MATAFYVVDWADYHVMSGPTGYEDARVLYGPLASREECKQVWDPSMDEEGVIVEMDLGDDAPVPFDGTPAEQAERAAVLARETLARRVDELAELWALVPADRRDAVDAECGGLVAALDALVDAAAEVDDDEQEVMTEEFGEAVDQLDATEAVNARIRDLVKPHVALGTTSHMDAIDLASAVLRVLNGEED